MENKKVCPFKKRVRVIPAQRIYQDTFAWCDGERCMAYRDGICLRLERPYQKNKDGEQNG